MIDWVEGLLAPAAADRGLNFVFPSQAAADSWLRRAPELFGLKAIETERFIGWDRFKERLLSRRRAERPADRVSRSLWAAGILARQARAPFLKSILGPYEPSAAFAGFLARIPPTLSTILRRAGSPGDEMLADLALLRADYADFLRTKGLFEPAWEELPAPQGGERFELIAPELMEDFEEYASALRAAPGIVLHPLDSSAPPPRLLRFANAFEELRWAFLEIGRLLDSGERPEDIAVTLPSLEQAAPYVRAAAARAGVPISIREGPPLAASPYGRFLAALAGCARSGFAFEETKDLLLDRFLPWNERTAQAARDLVRFGIERHAYAPYMEGGRRVDAWERSFERCAAGPELDLRDFYRRLKAAVGAIAGARDFATLEAKIVAFRGQFFDESSWTQEELSRVQRAMVELGTLVRAEAELDCAGAVPEPFALFLRSLGELRYVPRTAEASVAVYPYRVAALVAARHHFVLGCSQEGTAVRYATAPFLREDQREALGLADRDASDDFARAYALDGGARFSYAERGIDGWSAPAAFFLGTAAPGDAADGPPRSTAGGAVPLPAAELEELLRRDPLRAEAAAWKAGSPLPRVLLPVQKLAAADAAASLADKGSDYADPVTRASGAAREAVLAGRRSPSGELRLSPTQLEEYLACPFAWLLGRGLGLEEEPSGIAFFDARLAGEMAHEAVRRLFARMAESGPVSASRLASYLALVPEAIASALPKFEREEGPFLAPMFSAYAPLLEDRLRRLVTAESWLEGWEVGELERSFSQAYPKLGVLLEGRADRVALRGEEAALVDYKKRRLPRKDDLVVAGEGAEGELGDLQIAAYVALCEAEGRRVERAAYWSIEDARRLVVIGPDGLRSREEYEAELAALRRALAAVASGLSQGDFSLAQPGGEGCGSCGWAAICRCRYATE